MDSALTWQARQGMAGLEVAGQGRLGEARLGEARPGRAWQGRRGMAWLGAARLGKAGRAGSAWQGRARKGVAWQAGMNRVDTNERISTYGQDGYVGFGFECFDDCACIGGRRPFGPSKRQCVCVNRTHGTSRRIVQVRRCGFQHP